MKYVVEKAIRVRDKRHTGFRFVKWVEVGRFLTQKAAEKLARQIIKGEVTSEPSQRLKRGYFGKKTGLWWDSRIIIKK